MSIMNHGEKGTPRKVLLFFFVLFLVATTSFALGYLASETNKKTPIIIEKTS